MNITVKILNENERHIEPWKMDSRVCTFLLTVPFFSSSSLATTAAAAGKKTCTRFTAQNFYHFNPSWCFCTRSLAGQPPRYHVSMDVFFPSSEQLLSGLNWLHTFYELSMPLKPTQIMIKWIELEAWRSWTSWTAYSGLYVHIRVCMCAPK